MGYTLDQALTLASIIQSEASDPENMPMVSSVFANRLKPGSGFGYLGSDVTRHYIEREMKAYIEEQGMDYDALFGAYCTNDGYSLKTTGLPAGPICNMGKAAIEAALNPAESKYYYFFTDNDHRQRLELLLQRDPERSPEPVEPAHRRRKSRRHRHHDGQTVRSPHEEIRHLERQRHPRLREERL